jgi:hypothetical protein
MTASVNFAKRSLKARITLFTLGIFLCSIWLLTFFTGRMMREDMQRLVGEQLFSTVNLIAEQINDELEDRFKSLRTVSAMMTPALLNNPEKLQAAMEGYPVLQHIFNGGTGSMNVGVRESRSSGSMREVWKRV